MTVALHGNLRDFGIGEVFQLIGQQRKSGILAVRGSGGQVELRFDSGRIVSAAPAGAHEHAALGEMLVRCGLLTQERLGELERDREISLCSLPQLLQDRGVLTLPQISAIEELLTRDTVFDLLRWEEGSFRFETRAIRHTREPRVLLGAEQVLMDGLRMVDEWRTFAEEIPSEALVFQRVGSFEDYRRARASEDPERIEEEERLFLLVDGRLSVRRVIDLSRVGTYDGMRILAELRRARLIECTTPPRAGRSSMRKPTHLARGPGRLFATLVGLAALVAMAVATHAQLDAPPPPPGFTLRAQLLDEARLRFETRLARNLLEAYRFARGRDPHTLLELVRWSGSRGGALATSRRAPYYYYARGERGMILLAPEH